MGMGMRVGAADLNQLQGPKPPATSGCSPRSSSGSGDNARVFPGVVLMRQQTDGITRRGR
jgi:hypothetical protein